MNGGMESNGDDLFPETTKEELTELQSWKDDIGLPALQRNQQLLIEIEQQKTENIALSMRLETYGHEVEKLKNETKVLREELDLAVARSTTDLQESSLRHQSLKQTEEALQVADRKYEILESGAIRDKKQIAQLTKKTTQLTKQIEQYEIIVDKMQKKGISLKDKMNQETDKLKELQQKYAQLDLQYYTQQSVTTQLASEVSILRKVSHDAQDTMDNKREEAQQLLKEEDHPSHNYNKTLRFSTAHTLKLQNASTENDTDLDKEYDYNADLSNGAFIYSHDTNSDTLRFRAGNDTFHSSSPEPQLKEQSQLEFDEMLRRETMELIEKHKAEITQYRKKLIQQQQEMKKITLSSGERIHHRHNPNNEQDKSKCKVFGWNVW